MRSSGVYTLNPLQDDRWAEFAHGHSAASVFHTNGWADALHRTYGFEPVVYTTSPPDTKLTNGVLFFRVRSWLTGRRLVSVPFADHCQPLVDDPHDQAAIAAVLTAAADSDWDYVELRPHRDDGLCADPILEKTVSYRLHTLDLRGSADDLFLRFHKSTIQRKIRRAEREGMVCEQGRSRALLNAFYRLMLLTRRRHRIPPQPLLWFANLIACLGDRVTIRVAYVDGLAAGSIFTIQHGQTLVYKYGCSDAAFHSRGVMPFLFWNAIQDAGSRGLHTFDLGRSDLDQAGLMAFKERLGGVPSMLTYVRYSRRGHHARRWPTHLPARVIAYLPDRLLVAAGNLLYRHMG